MSTQQLVLPRKFTEFMAHSPFILAALGFVVSVLVFGS